jgi:hypothetical protein
LVIIYTISFGFQKNRILTRKLEVKMSTPRYRSTLLVAVVVLVCAPLLATDAAARLPAYEPGVIAEFKKTALIRATSDEQLYMATRRFQDNSTANTGGLAGFLVNEVSRSVQRNGHKPLNDLMQKNMRPEFDTALYDKLTARLKMQGRLHKAWNETMHEVGFELIGVLPSFQKLVEVARAKCVDCDAVLAVNAAYGLRQDSRTTGFRASAEADVFFASLTDDKRRHFKTIQQDDKDLSFHELYYPDAMARATKLVERIPLQIDLLTDQIVKPYAN